MSDKSILLLPKNMQEVGEEASNGCCSGFPSETDVVIMWLLLELAASKGGES